MIAIGGRVLCGRLDDTLSRCGSARKCVRRCLTSVSGVSWHLQARAKVAARQQRGVRVEAAPALARWPKDQAARSRAARVRARGCPGVLALRVALAAAAVDRHVRGEEEGDQPVGRRSLDREVKREIARPVPHPRRRRAGAQQTRHRRLRRAAVARMLSRHEMEGCATAWRGWHVALVDHICCCWRRAQQHLQNIGRAILGGIVARRILAIVAWHVCRLREAAEYVLDEGARSAGHGSALQRQAIARVALGRGVREALEQSENDDVG